MSKKGTASWRPAQKLDVTGKVKGYRYRLVDKDPLNLQKKEAEGWLFVNAETGIPGTYSRPSTVSDGKSLTTENTYRELVLMALPEEVAKERDAYYNAVTDRQTAGLKSHLQSEARGVNPAAAIHGKVVIE